MPVKRPKTILGCDSCGKEWDNDRAATYTLSFSGEVALAQSLEGELPAVWTAVLCSSKCVEKFTKSEKANKMTADLPTPFKSNGKLQTSFPLD